MSIRANERVMRLLRSGAVAVAALGTCAAIVTLDVPRAEVRDASAIIGRPRTPRSVAGVARRTVRTTAYAAGAAAARVNYLAALPAGCVWSGAYYICGAARYQPYYSGGALVYVPV